jgi:molybdopterin-guanine dinucleotide biosynthesis protein A
MGRNKALLDFGGEPLIARLYRLLTGAFQEVLISANDAETYEFLGAIVVPDIFRSGGSLAGIHAGLLHSGADHCFFTACDMPLLNIGLVRYLHGFADDFDVVIPRSATGLEPLHSFYSRRCIPHIEDQLKRGNLKILDFFPHVKVREVTVEEIRLHDPKETSYFNINTAENYELAKEWLESNERL